MKKTTCRDFVGPCDAVILDETPEETAANCQNHVMEMLQAGDSNHVAAVSNQSGEL